MDILTGTFPYLVDASKATGGGDIPSFIFHIINDDDDFEIEGVKFTPLPGKIQKKKFSCFDLVFSVLFFFLRYLLTTSSGY